MNYVIDIDNHILFSEVIYCECCGRCNYQLKGWDKKEIEKINKAYDNGDMIILYTGRGWDVFKLTTEQLKIAGVKYHTLVMGKPIGKYIDKESEKGL